MQFGDRVSPWGRGVASCGGGIVDRDAVSCGTVDAFSLKCLCGLERAGWLDSIVAFGVGLEEFCAFGVGEVGGYLVVGVPEGGVVAEEAVDGEV